MCSTSRLLTHASTTGGAWRLRSVQGLADASRFFINTIETGVVDGGVCLLLERMSKSRTAASSFALIGASEYLQEPIMASRGGALLHFRQTQLTSCIMRARSVSAEGTNNPISASSTRYRVRMILPHRRLEPPFLRYLIPQP